jgi:hypothetical protein
VEPLQKEIETKEGGPPQTRLLASERAPAASAPRRFDLNGVSPAGVVDSSPFR